MKRRIVIAAVLVSGCGTVPVGNKTAVPATTVSVSLPDEPLASWTGGDAAVIERNCAACHSPEMIANQPSLGAEKWQATIDKMRTVYKAPIAPSDDPALVAALLSTQAATKP